MGRVRDRRQCLSTVSQSWLLGTGGTISQPEIQDLKLKEIPIQGIKIRTEYEPYSLLTKLSSSLSFSMSPIMYFMISLKWSSTIPFSGSLNLRKVFVILKFSLSHHLPGHNVGHHVVQGVALLGQLGEEELGQPRDSLNRVHDAESHVTNLTFHLGKNTY